MKKYDIKHLALNLVYGRHVINECFYPDKVLTQEFLSRNIIPQLMFFLQQRSKVCFIITDIRLEMLRILISKDLHLHCPFLTHTQCVYMHIPKMT